MPNPKNDNSFFPTHWTERNAEEPTNKQDNTKPASVNTHNRLVPIIILLLIIMILTLIVSAAVVIPRVIDYMAAKRESAELLKLAESLDESMVERAVEYNTGNRYISAFDAGMRDINQDYICWIKIDGTTVDYPVVRGEDNEKYLNLSFYGEDNVYGTPFLDYRCAGEYVPHIIIYGHNTRYGDMFSDLHRFLDEEYLSRHPVISLKANGTIVEYEIFSARETDVSDPAYDLYFTSQDDFDAFAERVGAPDGTVQIITLSTCVSNQNDYERVIVQAALRADQT